MVAAAITSWFVVALVFTTLSPEGSAAVQLLGALALGAAIGLTVWPLLWSPNRTNPGSLITAARRSALVALVVALLVLLRAIDVVTLPVLIFVIVGAVVVEIGFSLRR